MSGFHKNASDRTGACGTKLKNNLPHISSGIPSLDHVVGGGLPTGAIFVVEEDTLGTYSRVLTKYYLAEGVMCKHHLLIASADEDPGSIVKELPQACTVPVEDEVTKTTDNVSKMKIAWRYEGLSQVESSFGNNTGFGHHFDLSRHIEEDVVKTCDISYWNGSAVKDLSNCTNFKNPLYLDLLLRIQNVLSKPIYEASNKEKNILRISIQSLGSPIWMALEIEDGASSEEYGKDLVQFMYCLRVLLKNKMAVAFVTIPSHLFDDESVTKRLLYSVDNAVKIESFAGSSREANPAFRDYHGLFHVTKLTALSSLVPFVPPSQDLAFKLRRKKFVIEILHLPPELQESSEREQDDITATPSCGGFKKKDIEF